MVKDLQDLFIQDSQDLRKLKGVANLMTECSNNPQINHLGLLFFDVIKPMEERIKREDEIVTSLLNCQPSE